MNNDLMSNASLNVHYELYVSGETFTALSTAEVTHWMNSVHLFLKYRSLKTLFSYTVSL